jgi:hypothetical protein
MNKQKPIKKLEVFTYFLEKFLFLVYHGIPRPEEKFEAREDINLGHP